MTKALNNKKVAENCNVTIHGIHSVQALLQQRPHDIISLYVQQNSTNSRLKSLVENATHLGIKIQFENDNTFEQRIKHHSSDKTKKSVHQGIIAIAKPNKPLNEKQLQQYCENPLNAKHPQLWIVLDNIQDPQNLGAILRNAESCACDGIIAPNHHSAPLNQTARKIASGAAELINFYQVSNLARAISHLQQAGVWTIALDANDEQHHAKKQAQNLFTLNLTHHTAFVVGAEGTGLRQKTKQYCDQIAYLPMLGNTQSLNVAHATTVALFEAIRQRQTAT